MKADAVNCALVMVLVGWPGDGTPAGWLGFNYDLIEEVWVNLENSVANFFC